MTRLLWTALLAITPLSAQSIVTARAGVIYAIEGPVTINGQPVAQTSPGTLPQVNPGQTLATTRSHAEMLMGQDAVLWTGNNTQVRLDETNVDAPRAALLSGSAILEIKHTRPERTVFIDLGDQTAEINSAGVYRFDRSPDRIRVWSGALKLQGPPDSLTEGQSAENGRRGAFSKRDMDELHYFAAYRSFALENEAGRFEHWKRKDALDSQLFKEANSPKLDVRTIFVSNFKHAGFNLMMALPISAARAKYLISSEAGRVNFMEGKSLRLGTNAAETVETSRAEIFLGLGITARLNHNTRLHILDTNPTAPVVELVFGEIMIEVAKSAGNTPLRLKIGDTTTEIHKPGLYRFNKSGAVAVSPTKYGDDFFAWNSRRSLQLWLSDASFMADWQLMVQPGDVKHKQYGVSDTHGASILPVEPPKLSPGNPRSILDHPIDQSRSQ